MAHPCWLLLLAALPVLGILYALAYVRRRRVLLQMGVVQAPKRWFSLQAGLSFLHGLRWVLFWMLLVLGIAGPEWGREWGQSATAGRDVVIVLDLSRSMYAKDVQPNRLARAKESVIDLLENSIERKGGYRIALVVFAARAKVLCPLTHDTAHFREMLDRIDLDKPPADLLPAHDGDSGTRIGQGLIQAVLLHDAQFLGSQDILLFSDGDDPGADSATERAMGMQAAQGARIPVHTIGLGDPEHDVAVPFDYGTLNLTRLREGPLKDISRGTGGVYVPVHPGQTAPMGQLFEEQMSRGLGERAGDHVATYRQRYHLFFGDALALLALELLLGMRWRTVIDLVRVLVRTADRNAARTTFPLKGAGGLNDGSTAGVSPGGRRWVGRVAVAGALMFLGAAQAKDLLDLIQQGNAAFERQDYEDADRLYAQAQEKTEDPGVVAYNRGVTQYRLGRFNVAESHFRQALSDAEGARRLHALYGLANALVQQNLGTGPLSEAVLRYRTCLTEFSEQMQQRPELRDDILNNLELAKLLYLRAEAAERERGQPQPPRQPGNTEQPKHDETNPEPGSGDTRGSGSRSAKGSGSGSPTPGTEPTPTDEQGGGVGRLPPIPDRGELVPLSPEAAAAHLQAAGERLGQKKRAAEAFGPPPVGVLDR